MKGIPRLFSHLGTAAVSPVAKGSAGKHLPMQPAYIKTILQVICAHGTGDCANFRNGALESIANFRSSIRKMLLLANAAAQTIVCPLLAAASHLPPRV
jgi:hypothetical protein